MRKMALVSSMVTALLIASGNTHAQSADQEYISQNSGNSPEAGESGPAIPPIKSPGSLCYSEKTKQIEDFFKFNANAICKDKVDTNPDLENSRFFYQSPEANDCDLGLDFPGMPSFGFSADGLNACSLVKSVTGDLVDLANAEMQKGVDEALNYAKDKTGLNSFDINLDANDIVTGEEDYGGLAD